LDRPGPGTVLRATSTERRTQREQVMGALKVAVTIHVSGVVKVAVSSILTSQRVMARVGVPVGK